MPKKYLLLILCCLGLVLGGRQSSPSQAQSPQFEAADCAFYVPFDLAVTCGYLQVPEDRQHPEGRMLRLHVAIFKSLSADPLPDPVVYIPDGPGNHRTPLMQQRVKLEFAVYLEKRDLVVMDLRGVGYSEPMLDCRAFDRLTLGTIEDHLSAAEVIDQQVAAIDGCYQDFAAAGVNFAHYTSVESAADLRDLRLALGYPAWNVHSVGYGARTALALMRQDAVGLRSVVFDSPIAPQTNTVEDNPLVVQATLQAIFERCAGDLECSVVFPELDTRVYATVAYLNAEPAIISVAHPFTQQPYAMVLDGNRYLRTILQAANVTANLQFMPLVMDMASFGNYGFIKLLVDQSLLLTTYESEVARHVQLCNEYGGNAEVLMANLAQTHADLRDYLSIQPSVALALCERWGLVPQLPTAIATVADSVPTLILSGDYDGVALTGHAGAMGEWVPQAYQYHFLGVAHDVLSALEVCPLLTIAGFINEPTVDPQPDCYLAQEGVNFVSRDDLIAMQQRMSE